MGLRGGFVRAILTRSTNACEIFENYDSVLFFITYFTVEK